jgi:hypothetical protein
MEIGFQTVIDCRLTEEKANSLGFRFGYSKRGGNASSTIGLFPASECMPTYGRNAELFSGNLDQVKAFLSGIEVNLVYLKSLGVVTDAKIKKKEQEVRNHQLNEILKGDKK